MWVTNYEWRWILSSIPDPYYSFDDSTQLFDCCYYLLMTIVWYPLRSAVPVLWILCPSSVSVIPSSSCNNELVLCIRPIILLMLHSTPFALWTSPQWNRICEWSAVTYQQPTREWSQRHEPVKGVLLVINTAFKWHSSIIFQRNPFVSWKQSSHQISIIH